MLIDTHCHIHESNYPLPVDKVLQHAAEAGVSKMLCVGTGIKSSQDAVKITAAHDNLFAAVGVHPHDAAEGYEGIAELAKQDVVAIGEVGLDYYYTYSPKEAQQKALEAQIQIAMENGLPIIFHVREAFDDFWPIFDNFQGLKGVLHSFTDTQENLTKAFERGLYVGVNGISTFTKDPMQQKLYTGVPLDRMIFETDAPFLAPLTHRGAINEPAYLRDVAEHHAKLRSVSINEIAAATTANAEELFDLHLRKSPSLY